MCNQLFLPLGVVHAQGRLDEAKSFAAACHESAASDDVAAQAISLFDQKGNVISAGRARVALGSFPAVRGAAADGDLVAAV
jgi:hypothetical protein